MAFRLLVIDGADQGSSFNLPEEGQIRIGSSQKHADIRLNDLYVARTHCELDIDGNKVVVADCNTPAGTLVNGAKVNKQEVMVGNVIRVGNSHLRLEIVGEEPPADEEPIPEVEPEIISEEEPEIISEEEAEEESEEDEEDEEDDEEEDDDSEDEAEEETEEDEIEEEAEEENSEDDDEDEEEEEEEEEEEDQEEEDQEEDQEEEEQEEEIAEEDSDEESSEDEEETSEDETPKIPVSSSGVRAILPAPSAKPGGIPLLPAERLDELTGQTLGHYSIGAVLGRSMHGVVFRARDANTKQEVALRILPPDFPVAEYEMQKFIRAFKIVLPLRHPHLVNLQGAGKNGPYCWVAMQIVEGETLETLITKYAAKIKWKQVLRIGIHLARALEFLHQHHLVHGHITPHNVFFQTSDQRAKLSDLLLYQALEGSVLRQNILNLLRQMKEELPYESPEQTRRGPFVNHHADQYSAGAVLYALLTGQPPLVASSDEETVKLIREAKPKNPTELHRTVPLAMQTMVMKMLAKHPKDRYPTPTDLLKDLEKFAAAQGMEV